MRTPFHLLLLALPLCTAAAPDGEPVIEIRGTLIDIRTAEPGAEVYPQYKRHRFGRSLPQRLTGMSYAVSLREFRGPEAVRSNQACELSVALDGADPDTVQWRPTGESFHVNQTRYRLFTARYARPGTWMPLPASAENRASTIVFARNIRVAETAAVPGVVVARVPELRKTHITNPNLLILPDGSYLAACSGATTQRTTDFYRSTDRGRNWSHWSHDDAPVNFYSLFLHDGALYMMGTATPEGDVIIRRSDDDGRSWTAPCEGILLHGRYHSAPVPVVEHRGRIWRAMETNTRGEPRRAFVLSAPAEADLLQASSWTVSEALESSASWIEGGQFRQWIEGNMVVARDGTLVNLLRVDEHEHGRTAALVHVKSPRKLTFDPRRDVIEMPGGGKKFTVRYDSLSQRYYALTSVVKEEFRGARHGGIYARGIHCGLIRNTLALVSSEDLRRWRTARIVLASDNPFFDGFQYADWQFDGEDLIAAVRLAMEEPRGLPTRQHDANFLVFIRIWKFREPGTTTAIRTLHKTPNQPTKR
ncbi:exo-alpha-sialidase [Alistipes sp.]|uniref:exo-alpha-sialidase n=1 Tax=Alistipes sp. TaxID=1872444 RepID=UPI003AF135ED